VESAKQKTANGQQLTMCARAEAAECTEPAFLELGNQLLDTPTQGRLAHALLLMQTWQSLSQGTIAVIQSTVAKQKDMDYACLYLPLVQCPTAVTPNPCALPGGMRLQHTQQHFSW
jgi:hypothetical protein